MAVTNELELGPGGWWRPPSGGLPCESVEVDIEPGIAATPRPPYTAVIFTSLRTETDQGYAGMAVSMDQLAREQPGYLGIESARDGLGITVSYWRDEQAARNWKQVAQHLVAQRRGRDVWYRDYRVRVATVVRDYGPRDSPH